MSEAIKELTLSAVSPGSMTEEEFEAWCGEDVKAEWVEGQVIVHSPARPRHSLIASWLSRIIGIFLRHSDLGVVMGPEIQFRMPGRRRVPDLLVVLKPRLGIVGETRIDGPPDLAVEIVSPDSVERDYREKYLEYEAAGIREYWIIDYLNEQLRVYVLNEAGRYFPQAEENGLVRSSVLPSFYLRTGWLWQQPLPDELAVLRELGAV